MRGYDAWLTTDPMSHDGEFDETWMLQPHCTECGGWLKLNPERREYGEQADQCSGEANEYGNTLCGRPGSHEPHRFISAAWEIHHRTCTRCGSHNQEVSA